MKNGQYVVETCIVLFVCFFFSKTLNTEIIINPVFIQALYPF